MAADLSNRSYVPADVFSESFFAKADFGEYGWSPLREYPAYTEIIQQDTPARTVYFIESGLVKLSRMEMSGHEVIAGLRRRNWIIGAPAVVLGKKYSFTVTSLIGCKFRHISSEKFLSLVETSPEFARHMLRMFSQEIFSCGKTVFKIACLPARDRLKQLLYEIAMEIKQPLDVKDKVKLIFPLKHKELAQMVAVTPEHLSRLLKQLECDGIINRGKEMLVLNNSQNLTEKFEFQ